MPRGVMPWDAGTRHRHMASVLHLPLHRLGTAWDAIQINALLFEVRIVTVANVGSPHCNAFSVTVYSSLFQPWVTHGFIVYRLFWVFPIVS